MNAHQRRAKRRGLVRKARGLLNKKYTGSVFLRVNGELIPEISEVSLVQFIPPRREDSLLRYEAERC